MVALLGSVASICDYFLLIGLVIQVTSSQFESQKENPVDTH